MVAEIKVQLNSQIRFFAFKLVGKGLFFWWPK